MKIRKSTIVWFVLAVLLVASQVIEIEDYDGMTWADAIYVKDAKILPENEGKLVAVSGHPEMLEAVVDENIGVSFPSPKVYRSVEVLIYNSTFKDWTVKAVNEGKSEDGFETGTLTGRVAIGEFELDQEVIKRIIGGKDVDKEDFSAEDIAHMEETGSFIKSGGRFCYTDRKDENIFSNSEIWAHPEDYDGDFYRWNKDLDGSRKVWWTMWDIAPDDELTVVGIQKGNTLTYCDKVTGGISKDCIVSEDEMTDSANPKHVKFFTYALALLFVILGIRSVQKKKKEE